MFMIATAFCTAPSTAPSTQQLTTFLQVLHFAIEELGKIDTTEGYVRVLASVRLWWADERLAYPASELVQGTPGLLVDKSDVWWPSDVAMTNTMDIKSHDATSSVVRVGPDGSCYSSTVKEYSVMCTMLVQDFPFDSQICVIGAESWLNSAGMLNLVGTGRDSGLIKLHKAPKKQTRSLEFELTDGGFENFQSCYAKTVDDTVCYNTVNFYLKLQRFPEYYVNMVVVPVSFELLLSL